MTPKPVNTELQLARAKWAVKHWPANEFLGNLLTYINNHGFLTPKQAASLDARIENIVAYAGKRDVLLEPPTEESLRDLQSANNYQRTMPYEDPF